MSKNDRPPHVHHDTHGTDKEEGSTEQEQYAGAAEIQQALADASVEWHFEQKNPLTKPGERIRSAAASPGPESACQVKDVASTWRTTQKVGEVEFSA